MKPVLCGEMQVGRDYPDARAFWALLRFVCVSGGLLWDYDLETRLRSGMDNDGEVFRSLIPVRKEQFVRSQTLYIRCGALAAGFLTEDHRRTYFQVFGDATDGPSLPSDEGAVPPGKFYFEWNNTDYFSRGNGHFIGFTRPIAYASHCEWNPNVPKLGALEASPAEFMKEDFPPLADYPKLGKFYFRWDGSYYLATGDGSFTLIGGEIEYQAHVQAWPDPATIPPLYDEVFIDPPTRFMIQRPVP